MSTDTGKQPLKDLILEVISNDGLSIASLTRAINAKGYGFHRLEVGGYAKALADLGILRVRNDLKPCLVFYLTAKSENGLVIP